MSTRTLQVSRSGPAPIVIIGVVSLLLGGLGTTIGYMACAPAGMKFSVDATGLHAASAFYASDVKREALKADGAKIVDMGSGGYGTSSKTDAIGFPGYKVGWFALDNGEKAIVYASDPSKVVYVPTSEGFAVMISAQDPAGLLAAIKGGGAFSTGLVPISTGTAAIIYGVSGLLIAIAALLLLFVVKARNVRLTLDEQGLRIAAPLYGRLIPRSALKVGEAKLIDLSSPGDYLPTRRTNGIGLPGMLSGWFKLKNGEKALIFLAGKGTAVYVPTTEGYALLIGTPAGQEFMDALRT